MNAYLSFLIYLLVILGFALVFSSDALALNVDIGSAPSWTSNTAIPGRTR